MLRVGATGWPIKHSRSPVMFAHWFERYAIDARYELIPVPPDEAEAFFSAFPEDLHGCNVTVPHKGTAARCVAADERAAALGTVNTVWRDGETVRGTTSDGEGFVRGLDQAASQWREGRQRALVLGAGGAALAVADALVREGAQVMVANRTAERAEALAQRTGARWVAFEALVEAMAEADVLVNATSLGMEGAPPLSLDLGSLPASAVVADIVYTPLETPLLAAARARGNAAVDGLGMLMHQATVGFERWFGLRPEVDGTLREKLEATL